MSKDDISEADISEDGEIARRRREAGARALAEAEARRRTVAKSQTPPPKELGGRNGPEPTRFGDWELKGIISDF